MDTQSGSRAVQRYLITAVFADDIGFPSTPEAYFDEKSWTATNNRFRLQLTEEQCECFFNLPGDMRSVLEVCIGQLHEPVKSQHFTLSSVDNLPIIKLYGWLHVNNLQLSGWFEPGGNIRYWGTFSYGNASEEHLCVADRVLRALDKVSYANQGYPAASTQIADDRFVKIFISDLEQDITAKSVEAFEKLQIGSQVSDAVFKRAMRHPIGRDAKSDMDLLTSLAWTKGLV